ncbi:MAG TPA: sigma-54 dependent transcriptional regulator [Kofleriaceae bacterium]|nr:sigma-54 dependent transcriptional regulator [Kofleriaceae bacterium]
MTSGKPWVGCSAAHRRIVDTIRRLAPTNLEILITGPSGVGKERYARFVHDASRRAGKPFVAVNCGAIPAELVENELFGHVGGAFTGARANAEGLVAEAEGGTLLLDEIDALSQRNQVVLLRFLQEKEYRRLGAPGVRRADVRIIAATNCDLGAATREGKFRNDLLFRLRVAPIEIPPLRERPDDVDVLFEQYCTYYAGQYDLPHIRVGTAARASIRRYSWPGNVRELENCVRYLTCLQLERELQVDDLPFIVGGDSPPSQDSNEVTGGHANGNGPPLDFRAAKAAALGELERALVVQALEKTKGNITHAARSIGKPRRTFFALMRKHQISARKP